MTSWLKPHEQGTLLELHIQPGARKTNISGEHNGRLKIKVQGQPVDGKANEALIEFLSEILKISKQKIHLIQGESSRQKRILVELSLEQVSKIISF